MAPRVELVERLEGNVRVLLSSGRGADERVDLGTDDDLDVLLVVRADVELPVAVRARGEGLRLVGRVEGVGVVELDARVGVFAHDLEGKVLVDVGRLERQGRGGVEVVLLVLERRVGRIFVDGGVVCMTERVRRGDRTRTTRKLRLTERSSLALVHEELVAFPRDDNVPGVDRPGGAHEHTQDRVGRKDLSLVCRGELLDDGVVRRRGVVADALDDLKGLLRLGVDSVVRLVVLVEESMR